MPSAPHRPGPRCAGDISNGTADFGRIFFRCTFIADAGFVAGAGTRWPQNGAGDLLRCGPRWCWGDA